MHVSPITPNSSTPATAYATSLKASLAARAQQQAATGPTDSDGDHDGSKPAGAGLDRSA